MGWEGLRRKKICSVPTLHTKSGKTFTLMMPQIHPLSYLKACMNFIEAFVNNQKWFPYTQKGKVTYPV